MSHPARRPHAAHATTASPAPIEEQDTVDSIVPMIPLVLPLMGAVLIFLLAFIAVYMA